MLKTLVKPSTLRRFSSRWCSIATSSNQFDASIQNSSDSAARRARRAGARSILRCPNSHTFLRDQKARDAVIGADLLQRGYLGLADLHRVGAARVEAAPARRAVERRRPAGD